MQQFEVTAQIRSLCSVKIGAESFEDALVQAKRLQPAAFIRYKGSSIDHTIVLEGVSRADTPDIYADVE